MVAAASSVLPASITSGVVHLPIIARAANDCWLLDLARLVCASEQHPHGTEEVLGREWFWEERPRHLSDNAVPRHEQNGNRDAQIADGRRQGQPVHARHPNVGYNRIDAAAGRGEQLQDFAAALSQQDPVVILEGCGHHSADRPLVVHDDDHGAGIICRMARGEGHARNVRIAGLAR